MKLIERDWNGPVRALGGAGTGKTVAAMHRARWIAANRCLRSSDRVLFTTFTTNLAADIHSNLGSICSKDELARLEVTNLDSWVGAFLKSCGESRQIVFPDNDRLEGFWSEVISLHGPHLGLSSKFFQGEWNIVIQGNSVSSREEYFQAPRIGRGTRLDRKTKADVWKVFEAYCARLDEEGLLEPDDAYAWRERFSRPNHNAFRTARLS